LLRPVGVLSGNARIVLVVRMLGRQDPVHQGGDGRAAAGTVMVRVECLPLTAALLLPVASALGMQRCCRAQF